MKIKDALGLSLIENDNPTIEALKEMLEVAEARIAELTSDLENMTREKDIEYDRAENLQYEMDNEYVHTSDSSIRTEQEDQALYLLEEIKTATVRLSMGVYSEESEIKRLMDELLDC